ncbi:MAG: BamA/TamA family outer membrane protein [Gemmatimonadetes bacterium]|nr:BamA/TamA family outer membrane protein [Gemmatimonadota bacterium]
MAFPCGPDARPHSLVACVFGALWLGILLTGCVQNPAAGRGPFPTFAEFEGDEVGEVVWAGDLRLPTDSLDAVTRMHPPLCRIQFLPRSLCFAGEDRYELDLVELQADVFRLQLYYRDHGYYGTRVVPNIERMGADQVSVRFAIAPGDQVTLQELLIEGADSILQPEQVRRVLPLRVGGPFRRVAFLTSADTIQTQLQRRGHAYAEVLRNYSIDTIADIASVQYLTLPGPVVRVDSILILGSERLSRSTVLKQINIRQGGILQVPELVTSQRNLHQLSIVSFATVELAPDSLQLDADSTSATVVVRVVEAAKYLLNTAAGYGSVDCLRSGARLTDRNFLGGGRTLELSGSAAKIGVGYPTNVGLENSLCRRLNGDPFSQELTSRVAADFVQPRLLGTRTGLTASAHAERRAELTLFLRQSVGSRFAVSREVTPGLLLGVGAQVERGRTQSTAAVFCVVFAACTEDEAEPLSQPRWSNALTLSGTLDRTRLVGTDTRGFQARSTVAWAATALGSDDRYLSALGEVVGYRPIRAGWTLAGRLQAGQFLTGRLGLEEDFIPPERRFYAGGPSTVRGFSPNALGPQAYVTNDPKLRRTPVRYPLGGTRVVVGSAELNTPSPFLPQYLRLAGFVDAGQVWAAGARRRDPGFLSSRDPLRVTPGVGVRFTTPVGPIRVDVGYNAYALPSGPQYLTLEDSRGRPTGELLFLGDYRPPPLSFLDRLEFHIAVGQAY